MKKSNGNKPVKSIRHESVKRAHIPSAEEAGYESANAKVQKTPDPRTFSLNPIIHRGQDPELNWMDKYKPSELRVPVRSLYRHEHVSPELLINGLYRIVESDQGDLFSVAEMFGNATTHEELDKVSDYYTHSDGWINRLIQGDSLICMTSLLEREGMAGQVQCIYIDPPYGIKYGSNWQVRLNSRNVTDGQDESLTGEPEQIKAFRDTYSLGIHSYLSYLRDRLVVASELLHESGSCFVQISDENVHLVRCLMDEVFGSGNFISLITFRTTANLATNFLGSNSDYILWYAKDATATKYRQLYAPRTLADDVGGRYTRIELSDGTRRVMTPEERANPNLIPPDARVYRHDNLTSQGPTPSSTVDFEFEGRSFHPGQTSHWKTPPAGLKRLAAARRLAAPTSNSLAYVRYLEDFPFPAQWDPKLGIHVT